MLEKRYYKFSDMNVNEYYKLFGDIGQLKNNVEFCDYFTNFIIERYTMQGTPILPFDGKIGNCKVKQWILGNDIPNMHNNKPNYTKEDYKSIHEKIFETWNESSNEDFMKNHLMLEIMMFLSHTGNPCAYREGLKNIVSYHKVLDEDLIKKVKQYTKKDDIDLESSLNLLEKEYEEINTRNKGKRTYYELDKGKFLEMCIYNDEELRKISEDREGEDFYWREFILCKKFENYLTLTRVEYPNGEIKLSFHSYHQEFRIKTEKIHRYSYKILDFMYYPDGRITTSDNPVFDKKYVSEIPFDLDKIETFNSDTRYNFHGLDNRNHPNKLPFATDTNTFTSLILNGQAYDYDNWIIHDNKFSTDIIEATLYPLISKEMLGEAYGYSPGDKFDYLDKWTKLFIDYFYTIKKYAFNMHFCWLVKDPKLMSIYNLTSGWTQRQKISFFESKRIFKHLHCLIKNSGHKLSDIKNLKDLKDIIFEKEFLSYIPVYIEKEKDYFILTADLSITALNNIINETGIVPVTASKEVIRKIIERDNAIIIKDKNEKIKTIKDFEKYLIKNKYIIKKDDKIYMDKKIINKELKEISIDGLNQSRNLGNYFTAVEFIEKFCAAFVSERELGFDDNAIYTFLKPLPYEIFRNKNYFDMDRVFNENENGRNFLKTLNVDYIVNNLKKNGFFMNMKTEQVYHYINNKEFKGKLKVKKYSIEEMNKIENYEDLFVYREKGVLKSVKNILINGSTDYSLDIEKQCGIDFKYSRRWMVPIYNNRLDVEEILVYEMVYDPVKDKESIRNDNDTMSILLDTLKMAFELNIPFNTRISTKNKLIEFHDNLSHTLNLLKQEKEDNFFQHQISLPFMEIAAKVSHYLDGYTILDDRLKISIEGNEQRNCILSYADKAAKGQLILLSYQDPKEGKTSIELKEYGRKNDKVIYKVNQIKLKANRNPRKELEDKIIDDLSTVDLNMKDLDKAMLDICIANFFRNNKIKCNLNGFLLDPEGKKYDIYNSENISKCFIELNKLNIENLLSMNKKENLFDSKSLSDNILKELKNVFEVENLKDLKENPIERIKSYKRKYLENRIMI